MSKTIKRAYKYELRPDAAQQQYLAKSFGHARHVWNELVANLNLYFKKSEGYNPKLNYVKMIEEGDEFLREVSSVVLQQKTRDFDEFKKQYFNKKRSVKLGRPNWKRRDGRQSIRFTDQVISKKSDINSGLIYLPKFKEPFKFINHRPFSGKVSSYTVSKNVSGKYFISFLVKETIESLPSTRRAVGIDVGIKDLMVLSTGQRFDNPNKTVLERTNRAIKKAQRQLSRKMRDSSNRKKARLRLAKLHERRSNILKNYYGNISRYLVNNFDEIYMEDLNVSGMLKNRKLARAIHEISWSTLTTMISYKSSWYGRQFHQINRWFPSSKTCSSCGHLLESLQLSVREWTCPSCGEVHDRDLNAALNILSEGQNEVHGLQIYSSLVTSEQGASLPTALLKHVSKIERSEPLSSVDVRIEQAASL